MVVVEEVDDLEFEQCEQDPLKWLQILKKYVLDNKYVFLFKNLYKIYDLEQNDPFWSKNDQFLTENVPNSFRKCFIKVKKF